MTAQYMQHPKAETGVIHVADELCEEQGCKPVAVLDPTVYLDRQRARTAFRIAGWTDGDIALAIGRLARGY